MLEKTEEKIKNRTSRKIGNIVHTRHRMKTSKSKKHNTENKKMSKIHEHLITKSFFVLLSKWFPCKYNSTYKKVIQKNAFNRYLH